MIEKLQIRNFRKHKKLDITFGSDITTIIGSSFAGKSTIIKALKWVTMNKPAGDSVIRWGADKTSVRVIVDGNKITRIKGKSENIYRHNVTEYKAFGNDVPVSIKKKLNISDINFQGQFAAHFWFSETAGEVSRQLNQIVNLEVIDTTLANIASELRKTRSTIDVVQERLVGIEEQKKLLDYVDDLNEDLKDAETAENLHSEKAVERSTINELLKSVVLYSLQRKNSLELASDATIAMSVGLNYRDIKEEAENLRDLVENGIIFRNESSIQIPSLSRIKRVSDCLPAYTNSKNELIELLDKIENAEEQKCQTKTDLRICKVEFEKVVGDRCPICNRPMKKN